MSKTVEALLVFVWMGSTGNCSIVALNRQGKEGPDPFSLTALILVTYLFEYELYFVYLCLFVYRDIKVFLYTYSLVTEVPLTTCKG